MRARALNMGDEVGQREIVKHFHLSDHILGGDRERLYEIALEVRLGSFATDTGTPFCFKKKAVTSTLPAWSM